MKIIFKFLNRLNKYFLPSWIVMLYDLTILVLVFITSTYLASNFTSEMIERHYALQQITAFTLIFFIISLYIKPHLNIIRYTTLREFSSIVHTLVLGSVCLFCLSVIGRNFPFLAPYAIPYSVIIIQFFISNFILIASRIAIKAIYHSLSQNRKLVRNIMIFGAGRLGMITHEVLEQENRLSYKVVGFIDDNPNLQGKKINGVPVYSENETIIHIIAKKNVKEIIIAISSANTSEERKKQFINCCLKKGLQIREVADVSSWINGNLRKVKIQTIKIEDLLGREPISIDTAKISEGLKGKHILVTGAAGSIGSEIVRNLLRFHPAKVILLDHAESDLFNLHNELLATFNKQNIEIVIGNVADQYRMRTIFENYHPEIIFHASAYKHVPLMEDHPYEAVKTNIGGTKVMADLSVEFGVNKFVMISTDKAVNPTNVMGASKRICEIYIQSLSQLKGIRTQFVTTRFGNVLGSNGSVVPLFKSQIEKGGPITLTHKEITRYFMTIPEACQLVLEAGFMGKGSEIYVFDMGSPVRIYDLAEKMILLSGYIPHKDIKIVVTGLRPGEKLYEEVLSSKEDCKPTHNKKITIGNVRKYNYYEADTKITEMLENLGKESDEKIVSRMKDLVEEFISRNSKFEKLDMEKSDTVKGQINYLNFM